MKRPGNRSFVMDSEPLLESPPSSHCMPAVAADGGGPHHHLKEKATVTTLQEKVVTVASQEKPPSPTVAPQGRGGRRGGAPRSYLGRIFTNKVTSMGESSKEGDTRSGEVEEQEQEREVKKEKQRKRWSWMPDPEKRWPVQGW